MGRRPKQGLDYYPMDVTFLKDRKFRKVKLKYGAVAVMVYQSLLELIYGDKGYYLVYDDNSKDDIIWEVLERLQGKYQPSHETVAEIIEDLVGCELFSEHHFNDKIITSKRVQSTFYSATAERKTMQIDYDIWMLDEKEMCQLSGSSVILRNFINRPINDVYRPINEINPPINPQSKVKESKVKESKGEEIKENTPPDGGGAPSASAPDAEKEKPQKHRYGEYKHVLLSDKEYRRFVAEVGEKRTIDAIRFLDEYIQRKGYRANDHNLTIRKWVFKALDEEEEKRRKRSPLGQQGNNIFLDIAREEGLIGDD